jgi:hypothetical protein
MTGWYDVGSAAALPVRQPRGASLRKPLPPPGHYARGHIQACLDHRVLQPQPATRSFPGPRQRAMRRNSRQPPQFNAGDVGTLVVGGDGRGHESKAVTEGVRCRDPGPCSSAASARLRVRTSAEARAGPSGFAGSRGWLLTLPPWLSARLVCYLWVATGPPVAGRVHFGGLVARSSQSPEMPRRVRTCISAAFGAELVLNLSRWTCPSRTGACRRWR